MSKLQTNSSTNYYGNTELDNLEKFTPKYNQSIVKLFIKYLHKQGKKNIVDFGAGIGTLAKIYFKITKVSPICIEVDKKNLEQLKKFNFKAYDDLLVCNEEVDAVFSSNVFEHIENDREVMRKIFDKLEINGLMAVYLPAFNILHSDLDKLVGHYRRYNRKDLIIKLRDCGFIIDKCFYCDSIGFFASLFIKIVGFNSDNGIGSSKSLIFYDSIVFPISKILDNLGFKYLFGKNIFVIARKPY